MAKQPFPLTVRDPDSFFREIVRVSYREFIRDSLDASSAFRCALALARVGDWLWHRRRGDDVAIDFSKFAEREQFRRWMLARCPAIELVEAVAAGELECEATDTRKVLPSSGARRGNLPGGTFRSNRPLIAVRDRAGVYHDLETVFRETIVFWEDLMKLDDSVE